MPPRLSLHVLRCLPRGLIFQGVARRKIAELSLQGLSYV